MPTFKQKMTGLWHLFIKEVLKFGIVGGLAFIVNATVTWFLMSTWMADSHSKAKFLAGVVATIFSWILNRLWTFKDKRQENKWREAVQFAVVNLIGIAVETGCVLFSTYVLGLDSKEASFVSGTIIGTVLGTVVRYFAYRFWVYGNVENTRKDEDFTREEKVGKFVTEATNIITGSIDVDAVRAGARKDPDRFANPGQKARRHVQEPTGVRDGSADAASSSAAKGEGPRA